MFTIKLTFPPAEFLASTTYPVPALSVAVSPAVSVVRKALRGVLLFSPAAVPRQQDADGIGCWQIRFFSYGISSPYTPMSPY